MELWGMFQMCVKQGHCGMAFITTEIKKWWYTCRHCFTTPTEACVPLGNWCNAVLRKISWWSTYNQVIIAAVSLSFTNVCPDKCHLRGQKKWKFEGTKSVLHVWCCHNDHPYCWNHCWVCWAVYGVTLSQSMITWSRIFICPLQWTASISLFSGLHWLSLPLEGSLPTGPLVYSRKLLPLFLFANGTVLNFLVSNKLLISIFWCFNFFMQKMINTYLSTSPDFLNFYLIVTFMHKPSMLFSLLKQVYMLLQKVPVKYFHLGTSTICCACLYLTFGTTFVCFLFLSLKSF